MALFSVDLNAHIVSNDRQVYVARPGRRYALYLAFLEQSVVFPDLPFLDVDPNLDFSNEGALDSKILRSRSLRDWHRNPKENDEPSRDLANYTDTRGDRSLGQLRGIVTAYFHRMALGDLVVVPPSSFSQDALIGELTGRPSDIVIASSQQYGSEPMQGRAVKWLARIPKRRLPARMLDAIEKPSAVYLLERSLRPIIYEAAYGSYVDISSEDPLFSTKFNISSDDYSTQDDLRLLAFMNFIAANLRSFEKHEEAKDLLDAIVADLGSYAPDLRTNVNSPGFLTISSKHATPLVAAILFSLALVAGAAAVAPDTLITIGNSKAPANDACTALVAQRALGTLQLLGLDDWPTACEAARKAAAAAGITTTTNVTQRP